MKRFSKVLALGALAIASSAAMALPTVPTGPVTGPIPMPETQNGGLFVWAYNDLTGASTVQYLGLSLDDVLRPVMTDAPGVLDFGILANFASLFGANPSADNVFWGVGAGDSIQQGTTNPQRLVTTGQGDTWATNSVNSANIQLGNFLTAVNNTCEASVPCTSTIASDSHNANEWSVDWNGSLAPQQASNAIGTAARFFYAETVRSGFYNTTAYAGAGGYATWLLGADGHLTYTVPAVPLPAGVWLLISGLAGFAAVGRRGAKKDANNDAQPVAA
jgi:hypothetical protein